MTDPSNLAIGAASGGFGVSKRKPGELTDCLCWFGDVLPAAAAQEAGLPALGLTCSPRWRVCVQPLLIR